MATHATDLDTKISELLDIAKRVIRLEKRRASERLYHAIVPERFFPPRQKMINWNLIPVESGLDGTSLLSIKWVGNYQFIPWTYDGCSYCKERPDGDSYTLWISGQEESGGSIRPRNLHALLAHHGQVREEIQKIGGFTKDYESLYIYFKHYPDKIKLEQRECWLPADRF